MVAEAGASEAFLDALPSGLDDEHALAAIAAIARHIGAMQGCSVISAFADVADVPPNAVLTALESLDPDAATPDVLGPSWEVLLASEDRRAQGAHFTPPHVADRVVALTMDAASLCGDRLAVTVWDPTAGGGAFLLAAARALEVRAIRSKSGGDAGDIRGQIVSNLYASDLDPIALRVCDAALEIWAGGRARPILAQGDALLDLPPAWPTSFSLIVGNPPFLGQLSSDTARSKTMLAALQDRFGDLARGYVDQAGLFIELGLRHLAHDGALGLILPQSILGAADAAGVRYSASTKARLTTLWVDDVGAFKAAVEVIAAVFVPHVTREASEVTTVLLGEAEVAAVQTPPARSWAPLLAAAQNIPLVPTPTGRTRLGDIALVTAGFRQHFYGIADAVIDDDNLDASERPGSMPRLMTSGSIDPLANRWGRSPVKFAGQHWNAPVVMIDNIADAAVREWFVQRMVPKLLLASQTPVLEVVVDPTGGLVPSVPVISIEPADASMLWHLAAAVSAPSTCALMLAEAAGTGLSASAIRVRAKAIGEMVLPPEASAWDRGAKAAERAHLAWMSNDEDGHSAALRELAVAMVAAYGCSDDLIDWWEARLPKRRDRSQK